jgi:Zn-dependent protease with chaperone function
LVALKQVPALDITIKSLMGYTTEKALRLISMASAVRVNERQFPRVHRLMQDACYILDWPDVPEVFVNQSPILNAGAVGTDKPFVTLNSSLVKSLDDKALLAVLAHELAHIMSGHVLYKTLLGLLLQMVSVAVPVARIALLGIIAALREWDRKSELSADRASLLAVQDDTAVMSLLMTLAGGADGEMVLEDSLAQAAEYEAGGDMLDSVYKLLNTLFQTHPFHVVRLKELKVWKDSGAYDTIIGGEYRRRDESDDPRLEFEEAVKNYREDMAQSKDPLNVTLSKLGSLFESAGKAAGKQAEDIFGNIFSGKPDSKDEE